MICGMTSKSRMEGAPSALGITLDECPISRNFAYNFTGWLNPADFGPVKRGEGLTTPPLRRTTASPLADLLR